MKKKDAELFFKVRTHRFDEICEMADIDSDSAWKKIQKIKLIQKGIVRADKEREIFVVQLLNEIKQQRYYRGTIRKKQIAWKAIQLLDKVIHDGEPKICLLVEIKENTIWQNQQ